ncbi:MAG: outer membrane lipoprotein carrier protein LolA [Oligoflexia bacterium]|nr:outer membrane lipoprotein carrier protein LolA [Oligoflexia bacterium]
MKKNTHKSCASLFFTISISFLFASTGISAQKSPSATKVNFSFAKFQKKFANTGSVDAHFEQEVYQAALAQTKSSKGTLLLSKPGYIRWEIIEPDKNLMVSDGLKLYYYNPEAGVEGKGQVIIRSAKEIERQPIYRILTGKVDLKADFKVLKMEEKPLLSNSKEMTYWIELEPKKAEAGLAKIQLTILKNYELHELISENSGGNRTRITLQKMTLGDKLPKNLFQFKPPEGAELLK